MPRRCNSARTSAEPSWEIEELSTLAPLHLHRALYVIASGRELAAVRAQAPEATVLLDTHDFMPVAAVAYDQSLHDAPLPR